MYSRRGLLLLKLCYYYGEALFFSFIFFPFGTSLKRGEENRTITFDYASTTNRLNQKYQKNYTSHRSTINILFCLTLNNSYSRIKILYKKWVALNNNIYFNIVFIRRFIQFVAIPFVSILILPSNIRTEGKLLLLLLLLYAYVLIEAHSSNPLTTIRKTFYYCLYLAVIANKCVRAS